MAHHLQNVCSLSSTYYIAITSLSLFYQPKNLITPENKKLEFISCKRFFAVISNGEFSQIFVWILKPQITVKHHRTFKIPHFLLLTKTIPIKYHPIFSFCCKKLSSPLHNPFTFQWLRVFFWLIEVLLGISQMICASLPKGITKPNNPRGLLIEKQTFQT